MRKIRVAVLTVQELLRAGLEAALTAESGFEVAACPHLSPVDWEAWAREAPPDVVILDTASRVPQNEITALRHALPSVPVLFYVIEPTLDRAHQARAAGARGLIKADISLPLLRRCIEAVVNGELWFDRVLIEGLMDSVPIHLSRRDRQLLTLISRGLSNKEIAHQLGLTEGTIKFYLSRLFRKCSVSDRLELALFGLRHLSDEGDALEPVHTDQRTVLVASERGRGA